MSQLNDKNVYVFFTTVNAAGDANLYYFSSLVQIHDARMNTFASNVTITPTYGPTIRSGEWVRLMANVSNTGDFDETFKLTIKANATIVATNTSTPVPIGQSRIIIIDWKSTGMKSGRYTITANVTVNLPGVEGFANLIDNTASFTLLVRPAGDVNGDCIVNVLDVGFITGKLGTSTGMPGFSPKADLNYDGQINILDVAIVTSTLSQTC